MPVTSLILKTPATESKVLVSIYGSTAADWLLTKILASFGYGVPVTPLALVVAPFVAVTLKLKPFEEVPVEVTYTHLSSPEGASIDVYWILVPVAVASAKLFPAVGATNWNVDIVPETFIKATWGIINWTTCAPELPELVCALAVPNAINEANKKIIFFMRVFFLKLKIYLELIKILVWDNFFNLEIFFYHSQ